MTKTKKVKLNLVGVDWGAFKILAKFMTAARWRRDGHRMRLTW